jgi:hypothetical protein
MVWATFIKDPLHLDYCELIQTLIRILPLSSVLLHIFPVTMSGVLVLEHQMAHGAARCWLVFCSTTACKHKRISHLYGRVESRVADSMKTSGFYGDVTPVVSSLKIRCVYH